MLTIVSFTPEWTPAVRAFNARLVRGGLDESLQFPEAAQPEFSADPQEPLFQEYFLAVDGHAVRGGYFLTLEQWWILGQMRRVANYRLPLSEGLIAPEYRGIALALMRHALKREPLMYCLGMGSRSRPLPRTLEALKWPMFETSFLFRMVRPRRVLRNLRSVRSSGLRQTLLDLAAWSGAGHLIKGFHAARTTRPAGITVRAVVVDEIGEWANQVWEQWREQYVCLASRDADTLRVRYPGNDKRFLRVRFDTLGGPAGWAILLDTQMRDHKHFGNLRTGTIVDCFGSPQHAGAMIYHSAQLLAERGVDLMVSNQSHGAWTEAFRKAGFLQGPSNRLFAASPKLAAEAGPFNEKRQQELHLTRGDAAGPIHL